MALLGAIAAAGLGREGARVILLGLAGGSANAASLAAGFRDALLVGAGLALAGALVSLVSVPSLSAKDSAARAPRQSIGLLPRDVRS